jgi:hypothetical protein
MYTHFYPFYYGLGQDSETSVYCRYRNINFNSLNMLSTMFKKMVIVDASINAKQGINALKRTENLKIGLKAPHSISELKWVHLE